MADCREQRVAVKFCFLLGKSIGETLIMLKTAFGDDALTKTSVCDWFSRFKNGEMSIEHQPRSGCPSTSRRTCSSDNVVMEASADEEMKFYDETAAFIYGSVSSPLPPDLPKEPHGADSNGLFVKTEATSPDRDTSDVDENPGFQLECKPNLKMFIKTEVTSPVRDNIEERSISPSGLPKETCEVDSKEWFVKTEATSPNRGMSDVDPDPGGLQIEYEPNVNMIIKTEVTSPPRDYIEEYSITLSDPANYEATGSDQSLRSSYCSHTAQLQSDLLDHVDSSHETLNANRHCDYNTSLKNNVEIHVDSTHKQLRPFHCFHCEYKSSRKGTLKNHIDRVHTKMRVFQCPHCKHKSRQKSALKNHIDCVHKKSRAFHCPHCEYKRSQKSILKSHIKCVHQKIGRNLEIHVDSTHKQLRPFHCFHCEYKSSRKGTLKNHIDRVHKNIRAFQCPHCEYKGSRKRTLKNHIDVQHTSVCLL